MSEFGLETLALLIGPKRTFHIALGDDGKSENFDSEAKLNISL